METQDGAVHEAKLLAAVAALKSAFPWSARAFTLVSTLLVVPGSYCSVNVNVWLCPAPRL